MSLARALEAATAFQAKWQHREDPELKATRTRLWNEVEAQVRAIAIEAARAHSAEPVVTPKALNGKRGR